MNFDRTHDCTNWILEKKGKHGEVSYAFRSITNEIVFECKRKRLSVSDHFRIYANRQSIASIRRKHWSVMPKYAIYSDGKMIALVKRQWDLKKISFTVENMSSNEIWQVDSEKEDDQILKARYGQRQYAMPEYRYLENVFSLKDSRNGLVMVFKPDIEALEVRYLIDIRDSDDTLICLCIALAVDLAIDIVRNPYLDTS